MQLSFIELLYLSDGIWTSEECNSQYLWKLSDEEDDRKGVEVQLLRHGYS